MPEDANRNRTSTAIVLGVVLGAVVLLIGSSAAVTAYFFLTPVPALPVQDAALAVAPEPPAAPEVAPESVTPPPAKEEHGTAGPPAAVGLEPPVAGHTSKAAPATAVIYLAAQQPLEVTDVKKDDKPLARPVRAAGRTFEQSIWAQPATDRGSSQVSYRLPGKYAKLAGSAGLADGGDKKPESSAPANAVFRVYGDGNLLWESKPLSGQGATQDFEVAVPGVDVLALSCESNSPAAASAFFWGDPRLTEK